MPRKGLQEQLNQLAQTVNRLVEHVTAPPDRVSSGRGGSSSQSSQGRSRSSRNLTTAIARAERLHTFASPRAPGRQQSVDSDDDFESEASVRRPGSATRQTSSTDHQANAAIEAEHAYQHSYPAAPAPASSTSGSRSATPIRIAERAGSAAVEVLEEDVPRPHAPSVSALSHVSSVWVCTNSARILVAFGVSISDVSSGTNS
jgi:hypothetical protein